MADLDRKANGLDTLWLTPGDVEYLRCGGYVKVSGLEVKIKTEPTLCDHFWDELYNSCGLPRGHLGEHLYRMRLKAQRPAETQTNAPGDIK